MLVVPYTAWWLFTLFLDISIRKPSGFQLSNNPSCSSVPTSRMDSILNMATVGNYSICLVSNSKRFPSGILHHTLMLFPLKIHIHNFHPQVILIFPLLSQHKMFNVKSPQKGNKGCSLNIHLLYMYTSTVLYIPYHNHFSLGFY